MHNKALKTNVVMKKKIYRYILLQFSFLFYGWTWIKWLSQQLADENKNKNKNKSRGKLKRKGEECCSEKIGKRKTEEGRVEESSMAGPTNKSTKDNKGKIVFWYNRVEFAYLN